jgi:hypothetical protein
MELNGAGGSRLTSARTLRLWAFTSATLPAARSPTGQHIPVDHLAAAKGVGLIGPDTRRLIESDRAEVRDRCRRQVDDDDFVRERRAAEPSRAVGGHVEAVPRCRAKNAAVCQRLRVHVQRVYVTAAAGGRDDDMIGVLLDHTTRDKAVSRHLAEV